MSWKEAETVRRWISGDHGEDPSRTLQWLLKRHIGEDCVDLDEFAHVLGVPREMVVEHARLAYEDTLRSMEGAREFSPHEVAWLERRAANLREICGLQALELDDRAG